MAPPESAPEKAVSKDEHDPSATPNPEQQGDSDKAAAKAEAAKAEAAKAEAAAVASFGAADGVALLKLRSEWADNLDGSWLLSDDLSSASEEWSQADESEEDDGQTEQVVAVQDPNIDVTPFDLVASKKLFDGLRMDIEDLQPASETTAFPSGWLSGDIQKKPVRAKAVELTGRRLQRVRAEVEALCAWSDAREASAQAASARNGSAAVAEAQRLGDEVRQVAGMVQRAVASSTEVSAEGLSKQMWLPAHDKDSVALVQHLLDLNRLTIHQQRGEAAGKQPAEQCELSYKMVASTDSTTGWLASAEGDVLADLEAQVERIGTALGQSSTSDGAGLASRMSALHARLDALDQVKDDKACDQMLASLRLLSTSIDTALAEAAHLEAVEADASGDIFGTDALPTQLTKLHSSVASLDPVARRVGELQEHLEAQEENYQELKNFARDLACAEAQAERAKELLLAAAQSAKSMKEASDSNRDQLLANIKLLDGKLAQYQAKSG